MVQLDAELVYSHEDSNFQYPDMDNDRILGLCTGALAAAAASCSRNTLDLIPLGIEAIIIAFKTGLHVSDVAQRIEPPQDFDRSWSMVVTGSAVAGVVKTFCEQSVS